MTPAICVAGLSRPARPRRASFDIEGESIAGLPGRHGAGKITVPGIIGGQESPTAGSVALLHRMMFGREDQRHPDTGSWPAFQVRHALQAASWFYPDRDAGLADAVLADFTLPRGRAVKRLSRAMRSALGIVIGLPARAGMTLFDESYAGLDPGQLSAR
jgi:ABC-2 type transport system ATP-binding protein